MPLRPHIDSLERRRLLAGELDNSFSGDGKHIANLTTGPEVATDLAVASDGSIIVAGSVGNRLLQRFSSTGAQDMNFQASMPTVTSISAGGPVIALQSDGKIVVANDRMVFRRLANGQPDPNFGTAGSVGPIAVPTSAGTSFWFSDVVVLSDGTIYASGYTGNRKPLLARFTSTGQLDSEFGTGGVRIYELGKQIFSDGFSRVELAPSHGNTRVVLVAGIGEFDQTAIVRLNANGTPDTTFDGDGTLITGGPQGRLRGFDLTVDASNRIVLLTNSSATGATLDFSTSVVRFGENGAFDGSFGTGGITRFARPAFQAFSGEITRDLTGRLIIAGNGAPSGSATTTFATARLSANGQTDTTWGTNGVATSAFGTDSETAQQLAIMPGGSVVAAGEIRLAQSGTIYSEPALARFLSEPAPPPTIAAIGREFETYRAILIDFSADIFATLAKSDVTLHRTTLVNGVATTVVVDPSQWMFAPLNSGGVTHLRIYPQPAPLPDGNYFVRIGAGAVQGVNGPANPAMLQSGTVSFLTGDANGDRTVNFVDLVLLAQNYGKSGKTFSQGNFDYSAGGTVNFDDLVLLAQRYNTSVPGASAALASTSTAGVVAKDRQARVAADVL